MEFISNLFNKIIITPIGVILKSLAAALPSLLMIGVWVILSSSIAVLLEKGTAWFLHAIRFNKLAEYIRLDRFIPSFSAHKDYSRIIARFIYWFVLLLFILSALQSLGFAPLTQLINKFILFIPRLLVAVIIVIAGYTFGKWLSRWILVQDIITLPEYKNLVSRVSPIVLLKFSLLIALFELNIARPVIIILLKFGLLMLAIAGGIALGMAGKDFAGRVLENLARDHNPEQPTESDNNRSDND